LVFSKRNASEINQSLIKMLLAADRDMLSNATDLASLPNTRSILHLSVTIVAAEDSVQSLLEASI
jgi:hypothetical protein